MKDFDDKNPGDADDKPVNKKTAAAAKYKAMVSKSDTTKAAQPLSPTNPLMVEKKDGSIGQWGNALTKPTVQTKKVVATAPMSDKAAGLSNTFYPANGQRNGAEVKTIRKTGY